MLSRVLKLHPSFDSRWIENPLWQFAYSSKLSNHLSPDWIPCLISLESISKPEDIESLEANVVLQTYIGVEQLQSEILQSALKAGKPVQIWIDRSLTPEETRILEKHFLEFPQIEFVYLPDLLQHPREIFKHLKTLIPLYVHLKPKEHEFDRWLKPTEVWDRLVWLQESEKFKSVMPQVLDSQIRNSFDLDLRSFILNPCYESLMAYLKAQKQSEYLFHRLVRGFVSLSHAELTLFMKQLLTTILQPTRANLRMLWGYNWVLVHSVRHIFFALWNLRKLSIFYPLRKTYWILEHFVRKRIAGDPREAG